jgi:hypothetical protein
MVDRSASLKKIADVKYYASAVYEVVVTLGDTITVTEFDSTVALKKAVLLNNSNGAEITCTVAGAAPYNVITVTVCPTDDSEATLFVFGRRA